MPQSLSSVEASKSFGRISRQALEAHLPDYWSAFVPLAVFVIRADDFLGGSVAGFGASPSCAGTRRFSFSTSKFFGGFDFITLVPWMLDPSRGGESSCLKETLFLPCDTRKPSAVARGPVGIRFPASPFPKHAHSIEEHVFDNSLAAITCSHNGDRRPVDHFLVHEEVIGCDDICQTVGTCYLEPLRLGRGMAAQIEGETETSQLGYLLRLLQILLLRATPAMDEQDPRDQFLRRKQSPLDRLIRDLDAEASVMFHGRIVAYFVTSPATGSVPR